MLTKRKEETFAKKINMSLKAAYDFDKQRKREAS